MDTMKSVKARLDEKLAIMLAESIKKKKKIDNSKTTQHQEEVTSSSTSGASAVQALSAAAAIQMMATASPSHSKAPSSNSDNKNPAVVPTEVVTKGSPTRPCSTIIAPTSTNTDTNAAALVAPIKIMATSFPSQSTSKDPSPANSDMNLAAVLLPIAMMTTGSSSHSTSKAPSINSDQNREAAVPLKVKTTDSLSRYTSKAPATKFDKNLAAVAPLKKLALGIGMLVPATASSNDAPMDFIDAGSPAAAVTATSTNFVRAEDNSTNKKLPADYDHAGTSALPVNNSSSSNNIREEVTAIKAPTDDDHGKAVVKKRKGMQVESQDGLKKPLACSSDGKRKPPPVPDAATATDTAASEQNDEESNPVDQKKLEPPPGKAKKRSRKLNEVERLLASSPIIKRSKSEESEEEEPSLQKKSPLQKKPRMNELARLLSMSPVIKVPLLSSDSDNDEGEVVLPVKKKPQKSWSTRPTIQQKASVECRDTDIILGRGKSGGKAGDGNRFYTRELSKRTSDLGKVDLKIIVDRVLQAVVSDRQNPPRRFVSVDDSKTNIILTREEAKRKISTDLQMRARVIGVSTITGHIPKGGLRTTDVLGGRGKKISREGNQFYVKELIKGSAKFGKLDTAVIVAQIMKAVESQKPPGRFCTSGRILTPQEVRRKVNTDLHARVWKLGKNDDSNVSIKEDVKSISSADRKKNRSTEKEKGPISRNVIENRYVEASQSQNSPAGRHRQEENVMSDLNLKKGARQNEVALFENESDKASVVDEVLKQPVVVTDKDVRPTDVIGGRGTNGRIKQNGNSLYNNMVEQQASHVSAKPMVVLVDRIVVAIESQNPPGRFLSDGELLSNDHREKKIAAAIRMVARRRGLTLLNENEDQNITRSTDVHGMKSTSYQTHKGTRFFEKLVTKHCIDIEEDGLRVVAERVMKAVDDQSPPGRFLTGDKILSDTGAYLRVVNALRARAVDLSQVAEVGGKNLARADESAVAAVGRPTAMRSTTGGQAKQNKRKRSEVHKFETALHLGAAVSSTNDIPEKRNKSPGPKGKKKRLLEQYVDPRDDDGKEGLVLRIDGDPNSDASTNKDNLDTGTPHKRLAATNGAAKAAAIPSNKRKKSKAASKTPVSSVTFVLRETDVVVGPVESVRKRRGNIMYAKTIEKYCSSTETEPIDEVIQKVVKELEAQKPSGRFVRDGQVLDPAWVNHKIGIALRSKKGKVVLASKKKETVKWQLFTLRESDRKGTITSPVVVDPSPPDVLETKRICHPETLLYRQVVNNTAGDVVEPLPTDVIETMRICHPGTLMYRHFVNKTAEDMEKVARAVLIKRVLDHVKSRTPPGRMIQKGRILNEAESEARVAASLRNRYRTILNRRRHDAKWQIDQQVIATEGASEGGVKVRSTDVLHHGHSSTVNPGTKLYWKLIEENADKVDEVGLKNLRDCIIKQIQSQNPRGRFLNYCNEIMSQQSVKRKVAHTLRNMAGIDPPKRGPRHSKALSRKKRF